MGIDPITLGFISAGIGAVGTVSSGIAASNQASYQAQVARNNAIVAEQNAQYATKAGEVATARESMQGRAAGAKLKSAQAASGIDVNKGSAVDVQAGNRWTSQLDTETTAHNAAIKAYGYRTQGANFEAEAGLQDAAASSAIPGAFLDAGAGLLGEASSLGFKWGKMQESAGHVEPFTDPQPSDPQPSEP